MAIEGISNSNWFAQANPPGGSGQTSVSSPPGFAVFQAQYGSQPTRFAPSGLMHAIAQALSQIGVPGAPGALGGSFSASPTSPSGSSVRAHPEAALSAFVQNLLEALHAQHASEQDPAPGTDSDNDYGSFTGAAGAMSEAARGGTRAGLQADLQNLLQALSASASASGSGATAASAAFAPSSSFATSSAASLAALQSSFQNLLGMFGAASGATTLSDFLGALSSDLGGTALDSSAFGTQA